MTFEEWRKENKEYFDPSGDKRLTPVAAAMRAWNAAVADREERIRVLEADLADTESRLDRLYEGRKESKHNCACEYDAAGDICMVHSPAISKMQARIERAEGLADAAAAIYKAVAANAAPMNVLFALKEVEAQKSRISLDPDLLIDLFAALDGETKERE